MIFYKNDSGGFIGLDEQRRCIMQINIPYGGSILIINEDYPDTEEGRPTFAVFKNVFVNLPLATEEEITRAKTAIIDTAFCAGITLNAPCPEPTPCPECPACPEPTEEPPTEEPPAEPGDPIAV